MIMVGPFSSFLKEYVVIPSCRAIFSCEIPFLRLISQIFSFMELLLFIGAKIHSMQQLYTQQKVVKMKLKNIDALYLRKKFFKFETAFFQKDVSIKTKKHFKILFII